jgi:hypothetical protein
MNKKSFANRTPLAGCCKTNINDDLLEAILVNKRRTQKYKHINPITNGGYGANDQSRQVLSYLMRRALKIVRRPGTYDIELKSIWFVGLSNHELDEAAQDVRRIYDHTQSELAKLGESFQLVRGIDGPEASVCAKLIDEMEGDHIDFYFRTVTFFNHICSPFSRQMNVSIDCPASWIWASAYTLKELERPGSDEEFIVACQASDGMMRIPKTNFEITPSVFQIGRVIELYGNPELHEGLHRSLSVLVQEGLEPDDYMKYSVKYAAGKWEERFMNFGRWLDTKFNGPRTNRIFLDRK